MGRKYRNDYPQVPIGGGNPYSKCARCHRSVPEINGEIDGHEDWCEWRKHVELEEESDALRLRAEQAEARRRRLEDALRGITNLYWQDAPCPQEMRDMARKALEDK